MALNPTPTFAVTPTASKTQTQGNYISLFDYSNQYLPEVYEQLAGIYGSQSVAGFLSMLGAESSFASDKIVWTEEGRLHAIYTDVARAGNVFTKAGHIFRVGETVQLSDATNKAKGIITAVTDTTFTVAEYKVGAIAALGLTDVVAFVDGSEFGKGTNGMSGSLDSELTVRSNKPIIMKEKFAVSGSDATQIGWVKVKGGYLWYLESEFDTRRRWEDKLELGLVNGETAEAGSDAETAGLKGTEGMFEAIKDRGNVYSGVPTTLAEWDTIIKRFDAQGHLADYTGYFDRDLSLAVDNLLGELNAGYATGVSYGMFDNSQDMAVNLGFKGFTRGTYNIFKTDWKVLNDVTLLGGVAVGAGKTRGTLIPMGTKEVYEGEYNGNGQGTKETVPYLQCKYRMAGNENRKYKTWVTGSVGGVSTDDSDTMNVHHLSERALNTVGANNFMLFEE